MAIINNNVQNVKFLRNGSVFNPSVDPVKTAREVALAAMNEQLNSLDDGTAILGRYQETNGVVKTLVGFAYVSGETKTLTVFDVEGASADVEELRQEINAKLGDGIGSGKTETVTAQLTALSGNSSTDTSATTSVAGAKKYADDLISTLDVTDTAVPGSYVSQVSEADGKISVARVALPDASTVSGESKVVIDVTQDKGAITATAANITGVKLAGYAEGTDADIAATDTLGEALGKLQGQINAMDKTASSASGEVVITVTETDGKVEETKSKLKDVLLTGYVKGNGVKPIVATDTVNSALSKLENSIDAAHSATTVSSADKSISVVTAASGTDISVNIKSGEKVIKKDGNNGIYTDIDLVKITTGLPAEIKERYQLLASDDSQIGTNIDIPKDSHIVEIKYITDSSDTHYQNLEYVYIDASGATKTEYVDISSLVLEAEFASGLTIENHIARGVVDPTSESFFTVGANGFKVDGISAHVKTEIEKLDATVGSQTVVTGKHVAVEVVEADGKLSAITVTEDNIADADDLAELSGKTFTVAVSSNDSITTAVSAASDGTKSVDLITDASKIQMSGFTAAESGFTTIEQFSSVTEAFKAVETIFIDTEETISASLNDLEDRKAEKTELQSEFNTLNDRISDLESGSSADLSAEIEARKAVDGISAQTYVANVDKKYISGATSLNDADVKLNDALKNIEDNFVGQVKVNNKALAEVDNAVNVIINAGSNASNDTNAIHVDTNDNGNITLTLGTIDVGTY